MKIIIIIIIIEKYLNSASVLGATEAVCPNRKITKINNRKKYLVVIIQTGIRAQKITKFKTIKSYR